MSRKEVPRPGLVKLALAGQITNAQGARSAHLSVRQFQRVKARYRAGGMRGLLPPPPRPAVPRGPWPRAVRTRVAALLQSVYRDVNDCHATEKLREVRRLSPSAAPPCAGSAGRSGCRPSIAAAPGNYRRPPAPRRRAWAPSSCSTAVSSPGWRTRGPTMTLLGAIDDATGTVVALHFRPAEDLHGYVTLLAQLAARHGLPLALYGDRLSVFVRNDPPLVAGGRTAGRPASDPVRPHPARTSASATSRPARRRPRAASSASGGPCRIASSSSSASRGIAHPGGRQRLPPRLPRRFQSPLCPSGRRSHPGLAAAARRLRHRAELPLPPHRGRATTPSASARAGSRLPAGPRGRSYAGVTSKRANASTVGCWSTATGDVRLADAAVDGPRLHPPARAAPHPARDVAGASPSASKQGGRYLPIPDGPPSRATPQPPAPRRPHAPRPRTRGASRTTTTCSRPRASTSTPRPGDDIFTEQLA